MSPLTFTIITIFPDLFDPFITLGVFGKAVSRGEISVNLLDPRTFTRDAHRTVDDEPFGGGAGMVFKPQPLIKSIKTARKTNPGPVVYLSPTGRPFCHDMARRMSQEPGIVLLCGRYEGVDQRVIDKHVDQEISIGDYVLSGGEPAAMVIMDAVARLKPGTVKEQDSVEQDSFFDGLLDHPHYTRPATYDGMKVPDVLLSGDHRRIREWREKQKLLLTLIRRPDLLAGAELTAEQETWLREIRNALQNMT